MVQKLSRSKVHNALAVPILIHGSEIWTPKKLRFPDFITTAHDSGRVVSLTHRQPLPQQWCTQEYFGGEGVQQIQLRTERTGIWGGSPLVRGSGGSCNLVQEISFHIVKFFQFLVL